MSGNHFDHRALSNRILAGLGLGLLTGLVLNLTVAEVLWIRNYLLDGALAVVGEIFVRFLSMLVVPLVFVSLVSGVSALSDPKKLGRVGGKALALAARGARVRAWDVRGDALGRLQRRVLRAGADVTVTRPAPAPVVLVDAPCSGVGRLRREPALRWGLEPSARLALQRQLLAQGAELVEPGGLLVYATCSLLAEENAHAPPGGPWERVEERVLWPHREGTDGFSWRSWRRN